MQFLLALIAGALFGAGLNIAQMTNPAKILNFLDFAGIADGTWDPSLLFVFAGALPVMFVAYRIQAGMGKPVFGMKFQIPTRRDIDARLVIGSAIFGVGWGLVGLCPGPAVAILPLAKSAFAQAFIFIGGMLGGMALVVRLDDWLAQQSRADASVTSAMPVARLLAALKE